MLDYNILKYKPNIEINNETGIDLLFKSFNKYIDNLDITENFVYVNEYYIARPDLISLAVYGDDKYADIICKINGISNPFELNEGNILYIPPLEQIANIINNNQIIKNTERIKSDLSISSSGKIGAQKEKNEKRSPSQQIVGDKNYIIDKSLGIIFY